MAAPRSIYCFLHVPFEGPGVIARWAEEKGHQMNYVRLYEKDPLPDPGKVDMLVLMGGPMNVFDFHVHSWMQDEIDWVGTCIGSGKPVLGICLGAQIIAAALGCEVYPGEHKEIGWFNLKFLPGLGEFRICQDLPAVRKVFHWHGDTFHIPEGACRIAESQAFMNQGFIYRNTTIALQFHLEVTPENVRLMIRHCGDEIGEGPFMQTAEEILEEKRFFRDNQQIMYRFLDHLEKNMT